MEKEHVDLLKRHLSKFEAPRINRKKLHLPGPILLLAVMAVDCGWEETGLFGRTRLEFLRGHLQLSNGIPSHDTVRRVFMRIRPGSFESVFLRWAGSLGGQGGQEVVSVDGKTSRGSHDKGRGRNPIHVAGAWANSSGLVLGQVKVDSKSNGVAAIPQLLDELDVEGDIVTIDSMGCQRDIARKIPGCRADHVLAVKGNQPGLEAQIKQSFVLEKPDDTFQTVEKDHGRIETRKYSLIGNLKWIEVKDQWPG
ncbi:MAG: Tnp 1-associated, partial [Bacteroidota bacterium]